MKKLFGLLLSLGLLASPIIASAVETKVIITIDGEKQLFEQEPIIVNDLTLVPMRELFESLGSEVNWDDQAKNVRIEKGSTKIILTIGSKTVFINNRSIELDMGPQILNGRTMVPLRFVSEALGATVVWDNKTKTVQIKTKRGKEVQEKGIDDSHLNLSYEQALNIALDNNITLKINEKNIERADTVLESASDNLDFIPSGYGNGLDNYAANKAFAGFNKAQVAYQMAQKQMEVEKDKLTYKVKTTYNDVLKHQREMKTVELLLEQAELKKRLTEVKAKNGMVSNFELTLAQQVVFESKAKLEVVRKSLDDAYLKLNQLIGFDPNDRKHLYDQPNYKILENVDIDRHVRQIISSSTVIWMVEQNIALADLDLKLYTFNIPGSEPYEAKELDVETAKNKAIDTKRQLEELTRSLYYSIKQLENQYDVLQATLAKAREGLSLVETKLELGMATNEEVFDSKLAIDQLEQQMFTIVVQLDNLKMAFEKPWVASGK